MCELEVYDGKEGLLFTVCTGISLGLPRLLLLVGDNSGSGVERCFDPFCFSGLE